MKNKKNDNILKDAINIVYDRSSEKAKEYGPFDESMASSARIASELTGKNITTEDFYKCMMALKLARLRYSSKEDTLLDLVAYTAAMHKSIVDIESRNKVWIQEVGEIKKEDFNKLKSRDSTANLQTSNASEDNKINFNDFVVKKEYVDEQDAYGYDELVSNNASCEGDSLLDLQAVKIGGEYFVNDNSNEFDKNQTND